MKKFDDMLLTKDGFVWLDVTARAKELWNSGIFPLYEVREDESECIIESDAHLLEAIEQSRVGVEVGSMYNCRKDDNELGYVTQVQCTACSCIYKSDVIISACPDCGNRDIACHLCRASGCYDCFGGSKFQN